MDARGIEVDDLTYRFPNSAYDALEHFSLSLPRGARCVLIGANGSGKSTLLRLLAGKRLCRADVRVFGQDVFRKPPRGISFLGTEWAMNPVVRSDISVADFLDSVGGFRFSERRDHLLDLLDVDLQWRMHAISDGERRRVQLCMGLMEPWDLLLLDEVTVDLDVQVRCDLLDFLRSESVARNATIVYATHIFDGIHSFPTHLVHVQLGSTTTPHPLPWPIPRGEQTPAEVVKALPASLQSSYTDHAAAGADVSLLQLALGWLREDRILRQELEAERNIVRGRSQRRGSETTDAKTFFAKYDYHSNYA